jgi:Tfp pilus assembly protein PilF
MRLDAEGEHPYSVVYHEYTHLLLSKADWMPLWLNEGLAEFYQNTDIREKEVTLGQPSVDNILWLRQNRILPLPTLFAVDHNSPYYHEENKGSIFYAESWALIHYLQVKDYLEKRHRLADYADLLAKKVDPITAATTAFGDLKKLQQELDVYVQQARFSAFGMKTSTEVDDSKFTSQSISPSQADALRADFLAYNQRTKDARTLLEQVLREDANNVSAHETMGFLEFREGHVDEAKKWYAQAAQLDSQSYLAHYYYAAMSMQGHISAEEESKVENSLRQAIKLNPSFAPSFDRLAVFLGSRNRDLQEAHMMGLSAVTLDPSNVGYRLNVANILMAMQRPKDAVVVLQNASKLAATPEQSQWIDNALMHAQEFDAQQEQIAQQERRMDEQKKGAVETAAAADSEAKAIPRLVRREFVATGPHRFVTGIIQDVHCDLQSMDLAVKTSGKTFPLHSENYYKIPFSALGFQPSGDLKPCTDLEGRPAKVEYQESTNKDDSARLISIELHK